jgi:hypothetical protein
LIKSKRKRIAMNAHTIIGETLRVSTFFSQFIRDRYEFSDLAGGADDAKLDEARAVLAAWDNREQRRGRPSREVVEARALLGQQSEKDLEREAKLEASEEAAEAARIAEDSLIALMVKASRIERIAEAAARTGDLDREAQADLILDALRAQAEDALLDLREVAGDSLWDAWLTNEGKSHLDGLTAAKRANRGTAWTRSRKGYATTIRNDDSAEFAPTVKRHAFNVSVHSLDEDAIAELVTA